jgi:HPt (histidine-containing phosphotransfer) domain-containing protein
LQFGPRLDQLLQPGRIDLEAAERLAHNLKTLAGTLGLSGLAVDAARLERALMDTESVADDEDVALARERVRARLDIVCRTLDEESDDTAAIAPLYAGDEPTPRRAASG